MFYFFIFNRSVENYTDPVQLTCILVMVSAAIVLKPQKEVPGIDTPYYPSRHICLIPMQSSSHTLHAKSSSDKVCYTRALWAGWHGQEMDGSGCNNIEGEAQAPSCS